MASFPTKVNLLYPYVNERIKTIDEHTDHIYIFGELRDQDYKNLGTAIQTNPHTHLHVYYNTNLEFLQYLPTLRRFTLFRPSGRFPITNLDFLNYLPDTMEYLGLPLTQLITSYTPIARFTQLKGLQLGIGRVRPKEKPKDIEFITELTELQILDLSAIPIPDLSLLKPLKKIKSLLLSFFTLDLALLQHISSLQYLRIRNYSNIKNKDYNEMSQQSIEHISHIPHLEYLVLQMLRFENFPSFSHFTSLQRLWINRINTVGKYLPAIAAAPNLTQLNIEQTYKDNYDNITPLINHPTLQYFNLTTADKKTDHKIRSLVNRPQAPLANWLPPQIT